MRVPKWFVLILYAALSLAFSYSVYMGLLNGKRIGILLVLSSFSFMIILIYQGVKKWAEPYITINGIFQKVAFAVGTICIFMVILLIVFT